MKRKSAFIVVISVVLAVLFAVQPTAKAASETAENYKEYISEVKIGVGKTEAEAASSLDGYTILSDNGKNVDLNQGAGGGIGSKGERVVYLGYKTTTERTEAITDLAVMNMKGGYSVKDYELLMEQYMTEQIIPFVDGFLAAIKEYRENYNSSNEENKARAQYVHDALNKLTDDDCGDAGLGDLLLNETKYEMGDEAYEALSESEKAKHADILTIISQANGKATLLMENLLVQAADTDEDNWIQRFVNTSYDDLLSLYPDMLPSDAKEELSKEFNDDAREILSMWGPLKEQLDNYEEKTAQYDKLTDVDLSAQQKTVEGFDADTATDEEISAYVKAGAEIEVVSDMSTALFEHFALRDYLNAIEYGEGTLLDFFANKYETAKNDITVLYPLAASLSAGQRAGLQFVTLSDLIMFSENNGEGYKDAALADTATASIYENVDREIYKKGGVALTSEALRAHAAEEVANDNSKLSTLTYVMMGVTAASVLAFGVSATIRITSGYKIASDIAAYSKRIEGLKQTIKAEQACIINTTKNIEENSRFSSLTYSRRMLENSKREFADRTAELQSELASGKMEELQARSPICGKLTLGLGVAMIVLSAVTLYLTYRDLVDYYDVEYSPIPKYIVDEKDITAYNEKGEKTVIKNLSAYYKAVGTNRAESDEWYGILGVSADLNGTVGRQWLALYAAKNENMSPIIADSLKAVVGSDKVPADYTTGIHMFGSDAAYNLNNTQFVWNNEAQSVFVYYNVDTSAAAETTTAGSSFTAGYIIIVAVGGLVLGAAAAVIVTLAVKKKKTDK